MVRLAVLLAAVASAVTLAAPPAARPAPTSTARILCGVERWTVKTLQDRPTLLPAKATTIAFLTSQPAPATLPATRLPFERHIYTV